MTSCLLLDRSRVMPFLRKHGKRHHHDSQNHQNHTRHPVQGLRGRFIGKHRRNPRPEQCKYYAENPDRPVRHAADGEMRYRAGQCCEGHDKYAGSNRCFQFVAQHGGQDEKHHHTAACTHEATDKTDDGLSFDFPKRLCYNQ